MRRSAEGRWTELVRMAKSSMYSECSSRAACRRLNHWLPKKTMYNSGPPPPRGAISCWTALSVIDVPTLTRKILSYKKLATNVASGSHRLAEESILGIWYFHVVSKAFSMSKKMTTMWFFRAKAWLIRWSIQAKTSGSFVLCGSHTDLDAGTCHARAARQPAVHHFLLEFT